jgi:hypothetical protein
MPPYEAVKEAPVPPFVRLIVNDPLNDGLLMDGDGMINPLGNVVENCGTPPLVVTSTLEIAVASPVTTSFAILNNNWLITVLGGKVALPHTGAPYDPDKRGWYAVAVGASRANEVEVE